LLGHLKYLRSPDCREFSTIGSYLGDMGANFGDHLSGQEADDPGEPLSS
jgi:hypothetical protein